VHPLALLQGDLLSAAKAGKAEKVKLCLDAGVDANCINQVGVL
jgi:23S rRNA A1618 N6-methylase RlmF